MLTKAVFVVVGCLVMAASAWAQGPIFQGETCGDYRIKPYSGTFCGFTPAKATYVFQNVGPHLASVGTTSSYWTTISCDLNPGETKQVVLDEGREVYITRADGLWSDRTLLVLVKAITPCDTCTPMSFRDCTAVEPNAARLVTGLEGGSGSTIGRDGALYVTENTAGRISRVDPQTREITTFASGLPTSDGFGGAVDVAFLGQTAYALVTLVGPDVGGSDIVGIYRVDGPDRFTVVADIGAFSSANPPTAPVDVPSGVQYALQTYPGGFLVTDGHHHRVLHVTFDGEVSEVLAFDNVVPTGLAVWGHTVYMAAAGPAPHRPEDGKVVAFEPESPTATEVASGASLLVDVEFGNDLTLYALLQGDFLADNPAGSPARPNTGALVKVNRDGTFTVVADGLDRPTSLEFLGDTAYVVTRTGEIWTIDSVSGPPDGASR